MTDVTTQIATLDTEGLHSYATELSQIEYQEPRIRFTRDELISIAERSPKGITKQDFKTFITLAMLQGSHPLLNECWMVKFGDYPTTFITAYKWYEREARAARPDMQFTIPQWYDQKSEKWYEAWPHDPKITAPYQGKIGVKVAGMTDYTWVTLRWDERFKVKKDGKPQAEWKNQPIFMMTKCLWKLAAEKFMPPRLASVMTEPEHQLPIEREGTWVNDPDKSPIDNAIDHGRAGTKRRKEESLFRRGDLSGSPTEAQLEEYAGHRTRIDETVIARKMLKITAVGGSKGHTASSKLSSGELEELLTYLRGLEA